VTTYNISERRNQLLQQLKDAADHAEVRVVTNIPNLFDTYYGSSYRSKAKTSIDLYTERLNPSEVDGLSSFFYGRYHWPRKHRQRLRAHKVRRYC
jgi:hypothetical protein